MAAAAAEAQAPSSTAAEATPATVDAEDLATGHGDETADDMLKVRHTPMRRLTCIDPRSNDQVLPPHPPRRN